MTITRIFNPAIQIYPAARTKILHTNKPFAIRQLTTSSHRHKQPATYSQQSKLPRLPIPDLDKSLEGYVKSLVPVLEQKHDGPSLAKEIEKRRLFARDFGGEGGLGRILQERLRDLDHISPHNWLDDTLWLSLAYHTWRAPLLVNSNWWLLFPLDPKDQSPPVAGTSTTSYIAPDPNPKHAQATGSQGGGEIWLKENPGVKAVTNREYEKAVKREWITEWQIRKASWIARRYAEFRLKLQLEEIPPDTIKAGTFSMEQYSRLFNFSRIPLPGSDAFSAPQPRALHLILMIDDFTYSVDVFSPPASPDDFPEPSPMADIEMRFKAAVDDAQRRRDRGEKAVEIGILTADQRDTWTANREKLLHLSPANRATLDYISASLLCISLDPYTLPSVPTSDPLRNPAMHAQLQNCETGIEGGRNRWLDKPMSIIVENNGRVGYMGEHSAMDAVIPCKAVEYVVAEPVDTERFGKGAASKAGEVKGWQRCDWMVNEDIQREIEECRERNRRIIDDSDASQLWWSEYGVDWIKQHAKMSPDAYIQQALQLAWYRDQGCSTATYETASTRLFLHGRTDTIRTLTSDSRAFVKGMVENKVDDKKRYTLLHRACETQAALTRAASSGQAFDRHLMGLRTQLRSGETHALFDDEMYAKSQEWKMSTSGLSAGDKFLGTGFGCAWDDGYGISYLNGPNLIKFGIESKASCTTTDTTRFTHRIVQALRDMRRVCEAAE